MGSKKRSAWQKQKAEFNAHLSESSHRDWDDDFFNNSYSGDSYDDSYSGGSRNSGSYDDSYSSGSRNSGSYDIDPYSNSPYDGGVSDFDGFDNIDAVFKRESDRLDELSQEKEAALREKACESKNRYATQEEAREALELCAEHGRRNLRIYKCKYCNGWHLTSKPKR